MVVVVDLIMVTASTGGDEYASWEEAIKGYERQRRGSRGMTDAPVARASIATPGVQSDEARRNVEFNVGKGRRLAPANLEQDGRMFNVIGMRSQQAGNSGDSSSMDVWLGNGLIDPKKGRKTGEHARAGQKSFVLEHGQRGAVREDAWLGNEKVNPSKGRGHVPDPAMMKGRSSLFDHMHQKPMNPKMDEERDAWIGHPLHKTSKGRKVRRERDRLQTRKTRENTPVAPSPPLREARSRWIREGQRRSPRADASRGRPFQCAHPCMWSPQVGEWAT